MSKANNSKTWIKGHVKDPFVIQAQKDGYRSRAAYKLIEIDKKYKIIKPGITVVDLGAAPGGWSQVLSKKIGLKGKALGIDLLEVSPIKGIDFIQGDFMQDKILEEMVVKLENKAVDLVISDMAPNISGIKERDNALMINLIDSTLSVVDKFLGKKGSVLIKVFQGESLDYTRAALKKRFDKVKISKPKASRPNSNEIYIIGKELK